MLSMHLIRHPHLFRDQFVKISLTMNETLWDSKVLHCYNEQD